jgi:hypothetical protein
MSLGSLAHRPVRLGPVSHAEMFERTLTKGANPFSRMTAFDVTDRQAGSESMVGQLGAAAPYVKISHVGAGFFECPRYRAALSFWIRR